MRSKFALPFLAALAFVFAAPIDATDWPHLRGPDFDGRVAAPGAFEGGPFGLKVAWKAPLGSSYAGVSVAGGLAVTMFTDGSSDLVAAFDAASGEEKWRFRLGEVTRGRDGSHDGPLSTPVIAGGRVFALGASGRLVALNATDGKTVWEQDLTKSLGAETPHFGFASTPLPVGGVLVVQAGGSDGRSIVGLDATTGETLWSHGDDGVQYQSPAAMTLAGRRQIVAVTAKAIHALAPEDGSMLWSHPLGEEDRTGSATPTFIGDDRFLTFISGDAAAFRVARSEQGLAVEELYRSKVLGGTYAKPVYHDGHVYGFRGQVLSCMKAADGERVWRSRPPGGDGLILVEDRLVIFGAKGNVVVAEASPEGYRELARVNALEGSSLTWPSFAGGRIYVRNLEEMAAVAVTSAPATAEKKAPRDMPIRGNNFAFWAGRVAASSNRQTMVDALFERHDDFPIVEGEWIHFVYRGEASDVSIVGSMVDAGAPEPLTRIEGTDLFYRSYRLEPEGRWEYRFQVDFEEWKTDPLNPRTVPGFEDDEMLSELVTPGYVVGSHLDEPEAPRGRLEEFTLTSEVLGYDKKVEVWLPPGYDESEDVYPLLIVNDGESWLAKGLMANTLDNLVGESVRPLVVAFVDAHPRWWLEAGGTRTDDYVRMQVEELLPALEERYRLTDAAEERAILGNLFYGLSSAYAAVKHPELFGGAALQSVYLGLGFGDDLARMLEAGRGTSVRFYLDWSRYDERNIDRGWDFAEDSRTLAGLLRKGGYTMTGGELMDSGGWGGWRNRADRMLTAMFPAK